MIKVTLKGIKGTISEHYFKTWDEANMWLDSLPYEENKWLERAPYDESVAIGYTIEMVDE